jgi:hypothetical protein
VTVPDRTLRITPRLIIGIGILALGLLWTLDNMHYLNARDFTRYWPVILIAVGAVQFFERGRYSGRRRVPVGPIVLMVVGALLLADNLHMMNFDVGDLIPIAIAAWGAKLVWDALGRRTARPIDGDSDGDSDATVHAFAMMAGVRRQSTAREFRGGDVSAIMGGVDLDLRNADIRAGEEVIIDALAFWGGVEIKVPPHWKVVGDVLPIMASFEDKTMGNGAGPTLIVRGTALMGAIEVKN